VRSGGHGESARVTASSADGYTRIFDELVSRLDYPMIVVTVSDGAERAGCLVGFSTQCSIDPARYAVFISKRNHTAEVASRSETMVVHLLRSGDEALARLFGEQTGDDIAKFEKCTWHAGPGGAPVITGCDWFAGNVAHRIDAGDHTMHLLDVVEAGTAAPGRDGQLGFQALRDLDAGHEP